MTNRELILEQFSKMDDRRLFKAFCSTNFLCKQCIFYKMDCQKHEQWLPEQQEPCDYAKACAEVSMNNLASAYSYYQVLEEFKKYGYMLVDMNKGSKGESKND